MIASDFDTSFDRSALVVLTRELSARLLNCSVSGCLLETRSPLGVGTIALLRLQLQGQHVSDEVRVVRCQAIEGAGSVYHVGVEFAWTTAPAAGSLRYAIHFGDAVAAARPTAIA